MKEPKKEILKLADILEWLPGVTVYQVQQAVAQKILCPLPCSRRHKRYLKSEVRKAFLG